MNDRDGINEFLRNEIRMTDMRDQAKQLLEVGGGEQSAKVDVLIQREQTLVQVERLLADAIRDRDIATTELE